MDFRPFAARYRLGSLNSEAIVSLARTIVDTEQATPTWVEIATISEPNMSDVGCLFERGLEETGVSIPAIDDAIWEVVRFHMNVIAKLEILPREGVARLLEEIGTELHNRAKGHVGDSHGLAELVGQYFSYDDLEERPTEVSCDGLFGAQATEAVGEHIIDSAREWLGRHGV